MRAYDWAVETAKETYSRLHDSEKDYGWVDEEKVGFRIKEVEIAVNVESGERRGICHWALAEMRLFLHILHPDEPQTERCEGHAEQATHDAKGLAGPWRALAWSILLSPTNLVAAQRGHSTQKTFNGYTLLCQGNYAPGNVEDLRDDIEHDWDFASKALRAAAEALKLDPMDKMNALVHERAIQQMRELIDLREAVGWDPTVCIHIAR